jgi:hypothetical protein
MLRLWYLALLLPAACTMSTDNRPHTVEYVTEAVLAPSCGEAQCHSTFSGNLHDIFDTVNGTRSSIVRNGLVTLSVDVGDDREDPVAAPLIGWITLPTGLNPIVGRMPWDAPLAKEDVGLLEGWIKDGAKGAQCDPEAPMGLACDHETLRECGTDWNFSTALADCTTTNQHCHSSSSSTPAGCGS